MTGERFILRELYRQEEWRCAWEACIDFLREHPDRFGLKEWMRYHFDGKTSRRGLLPLVADL